MEECFKAEKAQIKLLRDTFDTMATYTKASFFVCVLPSQRTADSFSMVSRHGHKISKMFEENATTALQLITDAAASEQISASIARAVNPAAPQKRMSAMAARTAVATMLRQKYRSSFGTGEYALADKAHLIRGWKPEWGRVEAASSGGTKRDPL